MGKYKVNLSEKAEKDLRKIYKSGDNKSIKRLERIFNELQENPFKGIGSPKALKYRYKGFWSRKINEKDRLVYEVKEAVISIFVVSALGHYDDK